jgi:hypothetical protein
MCISSSSNRGDKTPVELFLTGIADFGAEIRAMILGWVSTIIPA